MQPDITIEWQYKEAHHVKGLIDRIGGTVKNLIYCWVLSGDVVINTSREFANQISSVDCLFLNKSEFILEPEEV